MIFKELRDFTNKIYEISQKKQNLRIDSRLKREERRETSKICGEDNSGSNYF